MHDRRIKEEKQEGGKRHGERKANRKRKEEKIKKRKERRQGRKEKREKRETSRIRSSCTEDFKFSISNFVHVRGCVRRTSTTRVRQEKRLWMFDKKCCEEYLERKGWKWQEAGEDCIMRSFIICTLH
jgi:hypothetical protein